MIVRARRVPGECGERAMRVAREHASPPRDERAPHDALSARAQLFSTAITSFYIGDCTVSIIWTLELTLTFQDITYFLWSLKSLCRNLIK